MICSRHGIRKLVFKEERTIAVSRLALAFVAWREGSFLALGPPLPRGSTAACKTELSAVYRRRAVAEATFAATAAPLKACLIADKTAWLQANLDDVRVQLKTGCSKKLWGLVRSVSGRRGRGAKVAAGMDDEEGRVLQDE